MSISGDSIIMRNGRATSQVSIYNYPEHLNPFYEEDQHKRLRFWHVNKNKDNDRWKSISITSLKDFWPLKSFRRSKKKSSTLGINKTSESPPLLRRDCIDYNNTPYRNTMQNGPLTTRAASMGLERFEPYRSTIQVMGGNQTLPYNKRYNYGRSYTPQPQRSNMLETPNLTQRSSGSRTSTTSTNPFEDSDEEYDVSVEQFFDRSQRLTQSLMPTQRKTKRRAPIPVALLNKTNKNAENTLNSEAKSSQQTELRIEEDADLNISNLATEIQNFVDTSLQSEETALVHTPTKCNGDVAPKAQSTPKLVIEKAITKEQTTTITETTTTTVSKKKKESEDVTKISTEKPALKIEKPVPENRRTVEILYKPNDNLNNGITVKTPFILTTPPTPTPLPEVKPIIEHVEEQPVLREIVIIAPLTGPEKPKRSSLTKRTAEFLQSEQSANQATTAKTTKTQNDEPIVTSVASVKVEQMEQNIMPQKIGKTENVETKQSKIDVKVEQQMEQNVMPQKIAKTQNVETKQSKIDVKVEQQMEQNVMPLKIVESEENLNNKITPIQQLQQATKTIATASIVESTGAIPRTRDWKDSSLAPLQTNVPPEKRKSAKEIIESINRQQRLLKEAAERNMPETRHRLPGVITYNHYKQTASSSNDLDQNQSAAKQQNGHVDNSVASNRFRDPQKLENGPPVFAKCRVYKENFPQRESSPTTSNLDWNPLPKPKRNKDLQLD